VPTNGYISYQWKVSSESNYDFCRFYIDGANQNNISAKPVIIEDNVFIGACAIILKGVTIGKNSIIGAGSVVVSNVPKNVIVAGNPAKVIKVISR
jgi:acetyltransferase-like isoleucine patch superfamily enzyme